MYAVQDGHGSAVRVLVRYRKIRTAPLTVLLMQILSPRRWKSLLFIGISALGESCINPTML